MTSQPVAPAPTHSIPTHDEIIERARALRPFLLERQEEVEKNTFPTQEIQDAFLDAGFYKLLVPKRYGGYESSLWTFMKLSIELARGCPSSAWCYSLAHGHAFTAAAYFKPETQDELFADGGYLVAASFAYPRGTATRVDGGYMISGTWPYGSGSPYSNYYMGQTAVPANSPHGEEGDQMFFVASREHFELANDWGKVLGLRGSGSHSVILTDAFVPDHWVIPGSFVTLGAVDGETEGSRYHGNSMYAIPQIGLSSAYPPGLATGMAYAALDEYERIITTRPPERIPGTGGEGEAAKFKSEVPEYQKTFGMAAMEIEGAEAILHQVCNELAEMGESGDYGPRQTMHLALQNSLAGRLVWKAMEEHIWRTGGSSVVADGQRMQRYFRDMATNWTAPGNALREPIAILYAQMTLAENAAARAASD